MAVERKVATQGQIHSCLPKPGESGVLSDHLPVVSTLPIGGVEPPIRIGSWNILYPGSDSGFGYQKEEKAALKIREEKITNSVASTIKEQKLDIFHLQEFHGNIHDYIKKIRKETGITWKYQIREGRSGPIVTLYNPKRLQRLYTEEPESKPPYEPEAIITSQFKLVGTDRVLPPIHNVHLPYTPNVEQAREYLLNSRKRRYCIWRFQSSHSAV